MERACRGQGRSADSPALPARSISLGLLASPSSPFPNGRLPRAGFASRHSAGAGPVFRLLGYRSLRRAELSLLSELEPARDAAEPAGAGSQRKKPDVRRFAESFSAARRMERAAAEAPLWRRPPDSVCYLEVSERSPPVQRCPRRSLPAAPRQCYLWPPLRQRAASHPPEPRLLQPVGQS